jgi:hypothetical protein
MKEDQGRKDYCIRWTRNDDPHQTKHYSKERFSYKEAVRLADAANRNFKRAIHTVVRIKVDDKPRRRRS